MTKHKKVTGTAASMPAGIGLGVGISIGITVLGAAILAWLVTTERMRESAIGYGVMVILVLAAAAGALTACGAIKHRKLMVCGISAVGYYLALLLFALAFGGQFQGMGVTALMVLLGGGIAAILSLVEKGSGVRRHKIPRYR